MKSFLLAILVAQILPGQTAPTLRESQYCPNYPSGRPPLAAPNVTAGELRKVVINAPDAVCNDGSPAVMYVRAARAGATEPDGPVANRWLIHFEGGGSCSSFEDCGVRWCGLGYYTAEKMSSLPAPEFISPHGLLSRGANNPIADRNLVMLNYCSSDTWQGRKSGTVLTSADDSTKSVSLHFRGATIAAAALEALERGVTGLPRLTDATDVLVSGDSGGAKGARANVDRVAGRLPRARVRGLFEATLGIDTNGRSGFPAGDPRDPVYASKLAAFNRVAIGQRDALFDDSCAAAHPGNSLFLCDDEAFSMRNHITSPFMQVQDIQDPNVQEGFVELGWTAAEFSQRMADQVAEVANARTTGLERAAMTAAPAVASRNCGVHVTWSTDDYFAKRFRTGPNAAAYSFQELLWNWMTGATPSSVTAPRPGDTPDPPPFDPICDSRAPNVTPPPVATASSASFNFDAALAPESIVATFGANLANGTATAQAIPWPTTLGGVQVNVTDARGVTRPAPLYFVSPGQLLYLIPAGTATGAATIAIGTQRSAVEIAATAPSLYSATQNGRGVAAGTWLKVDARGARTEGLLFNPQSRAAAPIVTAAGDQVYLILYGTGMRGGPATATVGGVAVPVSGPVAQGQYPGLDQLNLGPLPLARIGAGAKEITVRQGAVVSNTVSVSLR